MPASGDARHLPRDERRRRTERAILDAAREQFGRAGYERTTIRSVARAAGVDPALVMQHYGSKAELFAAAAQWAGDRAEVLDADRAHLPAAALRDAFERFEGAGADREAAVALLRSCLTHPDAARTVRDDVLAERIAAIARTVGGPDAELRAALVGACLIGVSISRYVLELPPVAAASREDLERLLEPVLGALVEDAG